ncbi:MAG: DUF1553 domain-containing protein [Bryobacteraceae bacterium]
MTAPRIFSFLAGILMAALPAASAPAGVALLRKHCAACHNPANKQGALDLSTREAVLKGGQSGPAIIAGKSKESLLYQVIAHQSQPAMPFKAAKLPGADIAAIAQWIDAGAPFEESLFTSVIQPLFSSKCASCHHPGPGSKSGFDLTTREKLIEGGDRGHGIELTDPDGSLLVKRLRHDVKPGMPFGGEKVGEDTIGRVVEWIRAGAPYDGPIQAPVVSKAKEVDRTHWAFQPPVRPAMPKLKNARWARNPVDAFLLAQMESKGLVPSPEADKRVLLRRLYVDLSGLPPSTDEMKAFLADRAPDAYEKQVEKLLSSTQYGERWGRHWMDVWRYSDWYGRRELDDQRFSFRHIWRWRDWIIESVNEDKSYDRMMVEMLAGDEVAPNDPNTLRATGYLARSFHRFSRNVWLQDTVEHLAVGFLGVTIKCARCHDHKYDPIRQEEYYRLRAFFEPYDVRLDRVPGEADTHENGLARIFDTVARKGTIEPYSPPIYDKTYRFIRGDETTPDLQNELAPGVPAVLGAWSAKIEEIKLPLESYAPDTRGFVRRDLVVEAEREVRKVEQAIANAREWATEARQAVKRLGGTGWKAPPAQAAKIRFEDRVRPYLRRQCAGCHGILQRSDFVAGTLESMLRGGLLHGPAVIPGNSAKSPIVRYVRGELSPRMPKDGRPLPEDVIKDLAAWIDEMQPADPRSTLANAETRLARLEKLVVAKKLAVPALVARIDADAAKVTRPKDPQTDALAETAKEAERRYTVAQAQADLLEAQQALAEAESAKGTQKDELGKQIAAAKKKLEAAAAVLGKAQEHHTPVIEKFRDTSSGRRFALARWLGSRENPLTARVAVNHMWLRHFGKGLVPTVNNFGRNGARPLNQPLLDWLALEFMNSGWSMKHVHRLMVTSTAYRMISSGVELSKANAKIDPDNTYLWRMSPRRMEAEVVRDSVLMLAGMLDPAMGGPDIDEQQGLTSRRRSLYLRQTPDSYVEFLRLFDQPSPVDCYYRTESIMPQQALAVANSLLTTDASRLLARKIEQRTGVEPDAFVRAAFETVLGAPPTAQELATSKAYLTEQAGLLRDPAKLTRFEVKKETTVDPATAPETRARETFVHALLNHNEFLTVR